MDKHLLRFYVIAFFIVLLTMTYMQWSHRNDVKKPVASATQSGADGKPIEVAAKPPSESSIAPAPSTSPTATPAANSEPETKRPTDLPLETVETETYVIKFSPAGGVPVLWDIEDPLHKRKAAEAKPADSTTDGITPLASDPHEGRVPLINADLERLGLDRPLEIVLKEDNAKYYNELNRQVYRVSRAEKPDFIELSFESAATDSGLKLIKTYTIPRAEGIYEVGLKLRFINSGTANLVFNERGQGLGITVGPGLGYAPIDEGGLTSARYEFTTPYYKTPQALIPLQPNKDGTLEKFVRPGGGIDWAGIQNRYFMMTVIPVKPQGAAVGQGGFSAGVAKVDHAVAQAKATTDKMVTFFPRVELYGDSFTIPPGQSRDFDFQIFAGAKDRKVLVKAGHGLDEMLFFGSYKPTRALALLLMTLLSWFHGVFHSWGLAIIGVVLAVRIITFPIAQMGLKQQARTMAEQAKVKPFLDKINEKYKNDPQKKNTEMMKLYREHGINPFAPFKGCLWMIIQLPVFYALYRLLSQSFDLRGASFLWIEDLSAPDKLFAFGFSIPLLGAYFNLLPILTSGTQMLLSKLSFNPNAISDPQQLAMQKQMMYMVPVMVLVMTYSFPSGLTLYWLISNIWQFFQQQFVNKKILKPPAPPAAKAPATASAS